MELRDYQRESVDAVFDYFGENNGSPLVVLPTGSGKSVCVAQLVKEVTESASSEQILILSHRREILSQNASKLMALLPNMAIGIYSAGLGRKTLRRVTVAGIQSIYRKSGLPNFGLVIVDECHLIPSTGNGMYLQLLNRLRDKNPYLRLVGYTATPFRLDVGFLHEGTDRIFTDICYEASVRELISRGYLSTLVTKHAESQADLSGVRTRGGEFIAGEAERAVDRSELVDAAAEEICRYGGDRKSWLIFCAGVQHATHVADALKSRGVRVSCIFGHTPSEERDRLLRDFKAQRVQAICSVDTITTGFDAPCVDLIAMLRPTQSVGLWIQALGRGMRTSPETGKRDCLVLDFCGTVSRLGTIDNPLIRGKSSRGGGGGCEVGEAPVKVCPECRTCTHLSARSCLECNYEFPEPEPQHAPVASTESVLSEPVEPPEPPRALAVTSIRYRLHQKADKPPSMRVTYTSGLDEVSEWICFEHGGHPALKAKGWWRRRSRVNGETPKTVEDALKRAPLELREPSVVFVRRNGKFDEVVGYRFEAEQLAMVG